MRPPKRKLNADLRPLTGRALQSVIDTLRPWIAGAKVADLYAGQGRFGIACLDEGAEQVQFVENDAPTAKALSASLGTQASRGQVIRDSVPHFLGKDSTPRFDIVFADPPFRGWSEELWASLTRQVASCLLSEGIFLVKHPKRLPLLPPPDLFSVWKTVVVGESGLTYFKKSRV